jgi:hypothetical protein
MGTRYKSIIRSRAIRGRILEVLSTLHAAAPGMAMLVDEIRKQVESGSPFAIDAQELQVEMMILTDKLLVAIDGGHARITANGIDFMRAGLPWDGVDAFSGKVR